MKLKGSAMINFSVGFRNLAPPANNPMVDADQGIHSVG
jgi:hypothetical protein